ncbi:MAG: hypothetical protein Q8S49_00675, partial [Pseudomonas sp.]|nr:hypothetical protein [Pseudomonas sp.]
LNWANEGVGSKAAALVDLSTVAGNKISNPLWVKFQSAGWVNFPSAPTQEILKAESNASATLTAIENLLKTDDGRSSEEKLAGIMVLINAKSP